MENINIVVEKILLKDIVTSMHTYIMSSYEFSKIILSANIAFNIEVTTELEKIISNFEKFVSPTSKLYKELYEILKNEKHKGNENLITLELSKKKCECIQNSLHVLVKADKELKKLKPDDHKLNSKIYIESIKRTKNFLKFITKILESRKEA